MLENLKDLHLRILKSLQQASLSAADQEARLILQARLNIGWSDFIAKPKLEITEEQEKLILSDLQKRLSGMPLGRIYGIRNFYGLDFKLSESTLEPRADTEILIDIALKRFPGGPGRILDLGTGTGCILITLLHHWKNTKGLGIDLSAQAIQTAQENAEMNRVTDRAEFRQGSWAEGMKETFDLIVSNPPYIESSVIPGLSPEVRNHDPILALDGGKDGLEAYKKIFLQLPGILKPDGLALFEIGYDQARKIERLVEDSSLKLKHVHPDMAGRARVAEVSL